MPKSLVQILCLFATAKDVALPQRQAGEVVTERFSAGSRRTRGRPSEASLEKRPAQPASAEDIVVLEVMVDELQAAWWHRYRKSLERSFRQKHIVIRAQEIVLL